MANRQQNGPVTEFTREEVAKKGGGGVGGALWVVIDGGVYDLTRFAKLHPGGALALQEVHKPLGPHFVLSHHHHTK